MRICHVTPHLPPEQAANALLPFHLGGWARERGDEPIYVAHPPATEADPVTRRPFAPIALPGPVTWVPIRPRGNPIARALKLSGLIAAVRIWRAVAPAIAGADIVHVHSNGLLAEVSAALALRQRKPVVLTLYGTEIWHYRRRKFLPDLFTRAYRQADHVTFYSQGLRSRALEIGLARRQTSVIYPPVAREFEFADADRQAQARAELGLRNRHILVNVKRLHPLAGQRYLLEAMGEVIREHPDTRLIICGTGPMLDELRTAARGAGVEAHVTFAGLVDNRIVARYDMAADAFVLPSLLEACPTVALEALACGTPVISTETPGGVELNDLFPFDVTVVPRENFQALANAIVELVSNKRRTRPATLETLKRDFSPEAVATQFYGVYGRVLGREAEPASEGRRSRRRPA